MRIHVEELFHEVADLTVEARAQYFEEHGVSTLTRREVESLVAFDVPSHATLDRSVGYIA
ncbi:MAG: hypothetical protein JO182_29285, partial [Acidobacteriaceae bacterium]|nr:hypothetical protein [Acidobacteriaceae bacterium]